MTQPYPQHNHIDLGRWSGCPACESGMPDQVNHQYPDRCAYYWLETGIDDLLMCQRHGYTSVTATEESSTDPCLAVKAEGEFADYIHDPKAAVISFEYQRTLEVLARIKDREEYLEAIEDYKEYWTFSDCE